VLPNETETKSNQRDGSVLSAALHGCEVFEERNFKSDLELYSSYLVRENVMMTGPSYLSFLEKNVIWFGLDLLEVWYF